MSGFLGNAVVLRNSSIWQTWFNAACIILSQSLHWEWVSSKLYFNGKVGPTHLNSFSISNIHFPRSISSRFVLWECTVSSLCEVCAGCCWCFLSHCHSHSCLVWEAHGVEWVWHSLLLESNAALCMACWWQRPWMNTISWMVGYQFWAMQMERPSEILLSLISSFKWWRHPWNAKTKQSGQ